jgi:hypothetical protein
MGRRPASPRAARRTGARAHAKIIRDKERLALLAPGGAPDRPIAVASPVQVDVMAAARPCPLCDASLRVEEHAAETVDGVRLRVARVACTACGSRRGIWFRLAEPALH